MSDDLQQLYASPKHESVPLDLEAGMRPRSHQWAKGVFIFLTLFLPLSLILASGGKIFDDRSIQGVIFGSIGLVGITIMTLGKRKYWAYVGSVVCLSLVAARSLWSSIMYGYAIFDPSAELASSPNEYLIFGMLFNLLVPYLWYRFTFESASRDYFR